MTTGSDAYQPPPDGWVTFGSHANEECPHYKGPLIFSDEKGEDGFSLWERHDDCRLLTSDPKADYGTEAQPWRSNLLDVSCPTCHAEVGRACWVTPGSTTLAVDTHRARREAADANR